MFLSIPVQPETRNHRNQKAIDPSTPTADHPRAPIAERNPILSSRFSLDIFKHQFPLFRKRHKQGPIKSSKVVEREPLDFSKATFENQRRTGRGNFARRPLERTNTRRAAERINCSRMMTVQRESRELSRFIGRAQWRPWRGGDTCFSSRLSR